MSDPFKDAQPAEKREYLIHIANLNKAERKAKEASTEQIEVNDGVLVSMAVSAGKAVEANPSKYTSRYPNSLLS